MAGDEASSELRLAEAVAVQTARRVAEQLREDYREELNLRDAALQRLWRADLRQLRDDLTAKGLLAELQLQPIVKEVGSPIKVLVVDDYPEIRRALVKIFAHQGMEVGEAESGMQAAELLEVNPLIEVIVADISMPKNGYTLLEHVRLNFPIIEVVLTSGFEAEVERARQMGAFAFLPKPFHIDQAVLLVERAAEFRRLKLAATSRG